MKENVRNVNEKQKKIETKQCEFKDVKNITRLQILYIIYITNDFNWLKDV